MTDHAAAQTDARAFVRAMRTHLARDAPPRIEPAEDASDEELHRFVDATESTPALFDGLAHYTADRIRHGERLAEPLAHFAADVLSGNRMRPGNGTQPRVKAYVRDLWIKKYIRQLTRAHGISESEACATLEQASTLEGLDDITSDTAREACDRTLDAEDWLPDCPCRVRASLHRD